ncbi:DHHA1 domain-containing protein [Colwellia sp. 1_MG-2023]|uniref:DHHA1 domain-containing protein n=1 Tax=Colwellia sp. 1_MG-2023 TaxID=3062649 RepID=UPI0026E3DCF2|nr:DHHA1 domain-containing protein [Colwellia sp. 1_MG-2023]MDO6444296.1 DHHA1 domain-containing protein [Colwellia sp. 1_MG-2023]
MHFDVFNGDADGIIALVQLRLAEPKKSTLITGVKRDIALVENVSTEQATSVTILDVSMEKNITALTQLLNHDVDVFYVDHHRAGDIPQTDKLHAIIDTDANTCTSLLVNTYLENQYVNWAIAAAYGDNMLASAEALANQMGLTPLEKSQLKALGIYINYNGYGRSVDDLHFAPDQLFQQLVKYENPLTLIAETDSVYHQLENAYHQDMDKAINAKILADNEQCKAVELPDEAWARRVSGVFGNELANQSPEKAHIVFTINRDASYTVSLRAPMNNKQGAGDICAEFPTGGGRAAAAGVNELPAEMINAFIKAVAQYYT